MDNTKDTSKQATDSSDKDNERRSLNAIENMWDRELAKGDDEFYESFKGNTQRNTIVKNHGKTRRKRRKI